MDILDIVKNIDYINVYNEFSKEVVDFVIDSRDASGDSLYFGIKGENVHGGLLYKDAMDNGCVCAIVSDTPVSESDILYLKDNSKCLIVVDDVSETIKSLASYKRSCLSIPIIAITGSAGKTSTKDMMHSALSSDALVYKTQGNRNNIIGMPLSILNITNEEYAIIEMGMNHYGEISVLTNIAKPNVAIINNIGTAHIGHFGSKENILKAKLEILEGLDEDGIVIINCDDDLLREWSRGYSEHKVLTYGIDNSSDVVLRDIDIKSNESRYYVSDVLVVVPIPGVQYIYNSLAAMVVGRYFNIDYKLLAKGISNTVLSDNRMDIRNVDGVVVINDTYNANYDATTYSLKNLSTFNGRKIACLGDMLELGDLSVLLHSKLGEAVVSNNIDLLITVGEYSKYITKYVSENSDIEAVHFECNDDAIKYINIIKKKGDTILVKASYSCNFKEIVEKIS